MIRQARTKFVSEVDVQMIVISFFLLLSVTIVVAAPASITTSTGRQLPVNDLAPHLRSIPQHEWASRVVELTEDGHLVTQTVRLPMSSLPFQARMFRPEDGVPVIIDGKPQQQTTFRYLSKTVGKYTVSYRLDKTPFSIRRQNVVLHPLHPVNHRDVFVDIPQPNEHSSQDDEGAIPIPNKLPPNNSTGFDPSGFVTSCRRGDPQVLLQLAVAFDSTLCADYGGSLVTLAAITDAVYMGMLPYHRQTCVRLQIVYFEGFCDASSDPYAAMVAREDTLQLMEDLRLIWLNDREVSRDLVYLFTASGSDSSAIGRAYLGAVCDPQYNVAWTEGLLVSTIAHEIGHAFNAPHTTDGDIMSPNRDRYGVRFFGEGTLATMEEFIGTEGGCLSPYSRKSPLIIPSNNAMTCQTGFGENLPVFVDWSMVKTITFNFDDGAAEVEIYALQSSRELRIYLWADSGHRIVKYRRRLAMKKLKKRFLGEWVDLKSNASERTTSRWSWSEIDRPASMSTCCGQNVLIHILIRLCNQNGSGQCLTKFARVRYSVTC